MGAKVLQFRQIAKQNAKFNLEDLYTDNIKFDVVNLNSDLQYSTYDSKCLNCIQIFDEKQKLIKKIEYPDISK